VIPTKEPLIWLIQKEPIRPNSRCPAIILDIKRTDKDTGRIKQLITSNKAIKGDRAKGDPEGTR